jgi:hypothetical protein
MKRRKPALIKGSVSAVREKPFGAGSLLLAQIGNSNCVAAYPS